MVENGLRVDEDGEGRKGETTKRGGNERDFQVEGSYRDRADARDEMTRGGVS